MNRQQAIGWAVGLLVLSLVGGLPMLFGQPEAQSYLTWFDTEWLVIYSLVVLWALLGLLTVFPALRRMLAAVRSRPVIYSFLVTFVFLACVVMGVVMLQPMRIHPLPKFSFYWMGVCLWSVVFLLGYDMTDDQLRAMGQALVQSKADRVLLAVVSVFLVLAGVEFWLRYFYVQTSGFSLGNANYQWNHLHWEMNALGYRDRMPQETDKSVVIVLGDSIAAGQGIPQEEQRFGNQLADMLGDGYEVYTVAERGWNAQTQLRELQAFPLEPDVLVYSYVLNDIMDAHYTVTGGAEESELYRREFGALRAVTKRLFIADYLHLNYAPAYTRYRARYADLTERVYDNADVWDLHTQEIRDIVDWARGSGAEVVTVVWASVQESPAYAAPYTRVLGVFAAADVPTVDTQPIIDAVPAHERYAFNSDPHPGVSLQQPVAQAIYDTLVENGIVVVD